MRGKRVKRERSEERPKPGRKYGGNVGVDIGAVNDATLRVAEELSRRAKEMKAPEVEL